MTKEEYANKLAEQALNDGCFPKAVYMCVLIAFILLLTSCSALTKVEYRDRDVNHYITNTVHDTLRIKETDSTHVETTVRNDTVVQKVYKEKTRWRDRIVEKHDTCYKDSIVTDYKETVREVVKYPKTYWPCVGISILFFIFAFVKLKKWILPI